MNGSRPPIASSPLLLSFRTTAFDLLEEEAVLRAIVDPLAMLDAVLSRHRPPQSGGGVSGAEQGRNRFQREGEQRGRRPRVVRSRASRKRRPEARVEGELRLREQGDSTTVFVDPTDLCASRSCPTIASLAPVAAARGQHRQRRPRLRSNGDACDPSPACRSKAVVSRGGLHARFDGDRRSRTMVEMHARCRVLGPPQPAPSFVDGAGCAGALA